MSHITFSGGVVIPSTWLNDVDSVVYNIFGNGTTFNTSGKLTISTIELLNNNLAPTSAGFYQGVNTVQVRSGTSGFTINNNANNLINLSVSDAGVVTARTSVVTPLVGTSTAVDFGINTGGTTKWVFGGASPFSLLPTSDNTTMIGGPSNRINAVFTPIIDSGSTGSLSLRTSNGVALTVGGPSGPTANNFTMAGSLSTLNVNFGVAGTDSNISINYSTKGTGSHQFWSDGQGNVQFEIIRTLNAGNHITVTGSNGGNPTISTTAGNLNLAPVVLAPSGLLVGTIPATGGAIIGVPTNNGIAFRNNANNGNIVMITNGSINGTADVIQIGDGNDNGLIWHVRSKAGAPTTSDISAGFAEVWKDTSGGSVKLFYNDAGTLKSVALV